MLFFNLFFIIAFAAYASEAAFTADTIEEFNIGQLFAFYNTGNLGHGGGNLCQTKNQFAVAKKDASGKCQWKIANDFSREDAKDKAKLPFEDFNGDCVFSCVVSNSKTWHTEKVINRFLKGKGANRNDYNMYTFLAPCDKCEQGSALPGGGLETAELDEYKGVYYSHGNTAVANRNKVLNNALLVDGNEKGLEVIKVKTAVDLNEVKDKVEQGKNAGKKDQEVIDDIAAPADKYLKNAVESYLKQHPQNP